MKELVVTTAVLVAAANDTNAVAARAEAPYTASLDDIFRTRGAMAAGPIRTFRMCRPSGARDFY